MKNLLKYSEKKKLELFKERLKNGETSIVYICPNFCKVLSFDDALKNNFTCPVCGSLMNEENKTRKIEMLKRNIKPKVIQMALQQLRDMLFMLMGS